MVTYLLGTADIESGLERLILEKTEGALFLIEGFVKYLKELGILERGDGRYHKTVECSKSRRTRRS